MSHKIIVESFNDKAIYDHILNHHCRKSDLDIESIENILDWIELGGLDPTKLIIKLKDIRTDIVKSTTKSKIGIIIDLDDKTIEQRVDYLNQICSTAFDINIKLSEPNQFISFNLPDEDIDFELSYCFSGLNGAGELEHLLKEIADTTNAHHANCLEQGWRTCLESKRIPIKDKQLRKLWMDFYKRLDCLNSKERQQAQTNVRWDKFLSLHPEKFDFNRNIPELVELKNFLTNFCTE